MSATRSEQVRYPRWVLPLAALSTVAVLGVAFPFQTLWRQQIALNAASSQISLIDRESAALTRQAQAVSTEAAAIALARADYQLVQPGQRLIPVLPGAAAGYESQNSTDPGLQPVVNPTSGLLPPSGTTTRSTSSGLHGFVTRFVRTLEFWR